MLIHDTRNITPTYSHIPFKTVIWHNEAALLCSIDFKFSWIKNHWVAFHKLVNQNGAKSVSGTFFIKKKKSFFQIMLISAVDFTFMVTVLFSEYVCKTNWLINWFFPLYKNCILRNFLMFFKVIDGSYLYKNSCPMSRKRSTAMLLLKNNALKTLKKCNFIRLHTI